jgi:hypothetical protein
MTNKKKVFIALGAALMIVVLYAALGGGVEYPDTDTREVDREQLFRVTEQLLEASETWAPELTDGSVTVASSLEPYPVRTVRYSLEVDADLERAVGLIRDENYSGKERRHKKDKYEDTLFEKGPTEWVRRSVHIAPPPGGNRDAVVIYFEDRPDPKTYRIAFQSVETIEGKSFPEVEDAVRFKVLPSIYKLEEIAPGRIRTRKIEAVDPRGAMSPLMNNHIISLVFFRSYMFEQAKNLRDTLSNAEG